MHKIFSHRRESHKSVIKGPAVAGKDLTRSWYKNLSRASQKSFRRSTSNTWHLQDLHARTSPLPGSPQNLLSRSCTGPCKDLLERTSPGSPQNLLRRTCARSCKDILGPIGGSQQDLHKIFSQGSVQDHARTSKNEQGALVKRYLRKSQNLGLHLVRARAVEMHMGISRGHFYAIIYREPAGGQMEHPDLIPAL